ncbi:phospholipid carrier-dependent glycosyltransferase [Anaerorhabdus sp.]|uniref:phospholipid carrier-dependent glycosyltransferase n=1 Tax=Anaerorhabdus sp. TaxID=1872524 RepID=UPI002FC99471
MKNLSLTLFANDQLLSILVLCAFVSIAIYILFKLLKKSRKSDIFSIVMITAMYAIVSLWQLGTTQIPQTWWQPQTTTEFITFEVVDETPTFDTVYAIGGEGDNNALESGYQVWFNNLQVLGSQDNKTWETITVLNNDSSYMGWNVTKGDWNYRYISLVMQDETSVIHEIAFKKTGSDELLTLNPITLSNPENPYSAMNIIDEQSIVPLVPSYFDSSYFDEIYHPRNAWEIANNQYMYPSVHPLLGTSIIALGIQMFGMNPFGWRIMGALFGIMILPLFYLILKKLFNNRFLSTAGTTLFAADFMLITTSRIGTLEPFSVFFILLMTYFMIQYFYTSFTKTPFKKQLMWLALSGISMGVACSVKWTGCYSAVALAIMFFTHFFINYFKFNKSKSLTDKESVAFCKEFKHRALKIILWCILFFVIIPLGIYALHYVITPVWKNDSWSIKNVIDHSVYMYDYHANLEATHPYQSTWYQWLFDIRPIWYYYSDLGNGLLRSIACFNNPVVTVTGVFTMLYTAFHTIKTKSQAGFIIVIGYLAALLPWVLVTRCVFSYHYYPSLPFLIMSIVYCIQLLINKMKNGKKITIAYVIVAIVLFVIFLPVLTGFTTTKEYVNLLQWLPSWYFGG